MDLWNNAIGRELAAKHKTKKVFARAVGDALERGRLIVKTSDKRVYEGAVLPKPEGDHSVIVLKEIGTGANEILFDFNGSKTLTREEFVAAIPLDDTQGIQFVKSMESTTLSQSAMLQTSTT